MATWIVVYKDGVDWENFVCQADCEEHACEQAQNAYPDAIVCGAIPENQGE